MTQNDVARRSVDRAALREAVYEIVSQVPRGCVITYGMIAALAGHPEQARLVGNIMGGAPEWVPAHRVVNAKGRIAPAWPVHRLRLEAEGVTFTAGGLVDMARHLYRPDEA